jgi:type IV pilus assembly protein PilY1
MLMLAASKDHTLFSPIYTDFEDLDMSDELGYGELDTGFKPTFKYYGYFDPSKCYEYSTSDGRFNPAANAILVDTSVTGLLNGATATQSKKRYTCSSSYSYWSGNFLNWASTTRLDVVRKMLYGGKRSTDTGSLTVLERTGLNWDAHSFTKYYGGTDVRDYTPYTTTALTKTTGPNANVYAGLTICQTGRDESPDGGLPIMKVVKGNYRFWNTVEIQVCRYSDDSPAPPSNAKFTQKLARYFKGPDGTAAATAGLLYGGGTVFHEVVLPSAANDGAKYGASNDIGPTFTVRVKACDANWIGEERCQAFPPTSTTNYKPYGLFQEFGFSFSDSVAARAEFGVIGGSYDKNVTGGALRKNMGDFADEINASTGVFCHSPSSGCATTLASPDGRTTGAGAIKTFDKFLLYGRTSSNSYGGTQSTPLSDGTLPAWGNPIGEMLVQALQYYAYNGTTPTPSNPSTTTKDTSVGLPTVTWSDPLSNANTDRKGKYGNAVCRPMYALALSSSALSFDNISDSAFETLSNRSVGSISAYTNKIGAAEGLEGALRSVGAIDGNQGDSCSGKTISTLSQVTGICPDAPAMAGTYKVAGAALYGNTSKIRTLATEPADLKYVQDALKVKTLTASLSGGAARIDIPIPGTSPQKYVYITPESLWNNDIGAVITFVSISSSATHGAFIVTWNDALMGGDYDMDLTGFLRYDLVQDTSTSPATWDVIVTTDVPNNCGGKAGTHGFSIIGVTKNINGTYVNGNGRYLTHQHYNPSSGDATNISSVNSRQGYYLCGNQTGDYSTYRSLTSANIPSQLNNHLGLRNWQYTSTSDLTGSIDTAVTAAGGACKIHTDGNYCSVQNKDFQVQMRFKMVGAENAILKDPLWFAAKYGSFTSSVKGTVSDPNAYTNLDMPANTAAWDKVNERGANTPDGIPDAYYLARRPDRLEEQLRQALEAIAKNSNAAPAVSSSQLISEGLKYVAKFDSTTVTGDIEAYAVDSLGFFNLTTSWKAGDLLTRAASGVNGAGGDKGDSRKIITNYGNPASSVTDSGGKAFRWASIPTGYKTLMTTSSTNTLSEANAEIVLNYMRGDQSKEAASTGLRARGDNIMGPVVNATPWIQDRPNANFAETQFPGYRAFVSTHKTRDKLLWVSAGDGMLHALNPKKDTATGGGSEVFAFVPGVLANRLAEIPLQRGTTGRTRLSGANFTLDTSETLPSGLVWPYVDGNPFSGDICLQCADTDNRVWKTYTFTALGRGGKAIVALDTTSVTTLAAAETGSNPASIFKWQFTSDDDSDLGYITGDISYSSRSGQASPIVKLNNGKFALMMGNGNKSTNGKAALFLIYVDGPNASTGSWSGGYKKIVAEAGPANGLSGATWIDLDGNGTADAIYAGDLKGNMWKFDVSSSDPANWDVAYKSSGVNKPLFTAKSGSTALPITTAPEVAFPPFDGVIVAFATGNAFESVDYPKSSVTQKVYGIWDRPDFANVSGRALPTDLTTLVSRTYERQSSGAVVVTGTPTTLDWLTKDGWYFSLPGTSEAVLSDPIMKAGVLTFTSVRPKTSTDNCSDTPNVTLYTIDPISGKAEKNIQGTTTISTTTYLNAGADIQDQKVRTVTDRTVRAFTTNCRAGDPGCTCTTTDGVTTCTKSDPPTCTAGQSAVRVVGQGTDATLCYNANARIQWREIPGLRTDR